jgi:hypothetical protein
MIQTMGGIVSSQLEPLACDRITWPGTLPLIHMNTLEGPCAGFNTKGVLT